MKKILFITVALSLLCGCGYREMEQGYLVTALGFSEQDGVIEIVAEALSSSVTDKNAERVVLSGKGSDAASALNDMKSQLAKPLYFEQLGTVVLDRALSAESKNEALRLLSVTDGTHAGIYVVNSDDVTALFNASSPDSILGYDIIGLVKNYQQQNGSRILNQLYHLLRGDENLPIVNATDRSLTIDISGE